MVVRIQTKPIQLKWDGCEGDVVVVDKDKQRYKLTIEQAIEACKAYQSPNARTVFREQLDDLFLRLGKWTKLRAEKIDKAFLTVRETGLLFLVVMKEVTLDEQFEDDLTDLDVETANSDAFSEIELDVQSLPKCDKDNYSSFCYPETTIEFPKP